MSILTCPKPPAPPRNVKLVQFDEFGRPHVKRPFHDRRSTASADRLNRALFGPRHLDITTGEEPESSTTPVEFVMRTVLETAR